MRDKVSFYTGRPHPNPLLTGEGKDQKSPLSCKERGLGSEVVQSIEIA
jgi:hypothetical protein